MKQFVDFFFGELCCGVDNTGVMYEKCCFVLGENTRPDERFKYISELIDFLNSESNLDGNDVRVLCILTLCELASQMTKIRESFLAERVGSNSLELDLEIALKLPGENSVCNDLRWPIFGSAGLHSSNVNVMDIYKIREKISGGLSELWRNKNLHPVDELSRCSLLYVDVLMLFSKLECRF